MHLIDKTITWNAFRASFKSKFTIIWGSIMFTLTFSCFFIFALVQQGSANLLFYNIITTSLLVLLTVMVWNIVNLNSLFSANQELGIMNLEIRKGRSSKEIYWSRLLVNKGITLTYILIMMILYLIIFAIFNHRDLTLFWMFLTYIPTDLFFTALFLFFYSMGRYKLTIALSSILLTLILLTPLLQVLGSIVAHSTNVPYPYQIASLYAANEVFNLARENSTFSDDSTVDSEPSFTYQLLNDSHFLNESIDTSKIDKDDDPIGILVKKINEMANSMLGKGLFFDSANILNQLWKRLAELHFFNKPEFLNLTTESENTLLYEVNSKFSSQTVGTYNNEYNNSLYSDYKVTSTHYESILAKLKNLNNQITETFGKKYSQVKEFNDLVYSYAQGMLFNSDSNIRWEYAAINDSNNQVHGYFNVHYQDYLERIAHDSGWFASLEKLDKTKFFSQLSISPELRLWNEIAYQLIRNALDTDKQEMHESNKNKISLIAAVPWTVQFSSWLFANPNLSFYDYWRLNNLVFIEPIYYWISSNTQYYNEYDSNSESGSSYSVFKPLNLQPTNFASPGPFKTFSIAGYEVAIAAIAVVFISLSFLIFFKRLKK